MHVRPRQVLMSTAGALLLMAALVVAGPGLPRAPAVIWRDEGPAGSGWTASDGGGLELTGRSAARTSSTRARLGTSSLEARIWTPSDPTAGVRAFRWKEPREHRSAWYSIWLLVPRAYRLTGDPATGRYWNVFQFKSRSSDGRRNDPLWAFYASQTRDGRLFLRAGWGWGGSVLSGPRPGDDVSGKFYEPRTRIPLPVGRWVHLQAHLVQSSDFDGSLTFWQDDVRLLDFRDVRTSYRNCEWNSWCASNEWSVNLYSDGMTPSPATVWFDGATIAR